ncbi:MAG: ABC transporter ATP-binding protein [Elusimicrobia bacterium]|nr:ABC transporter ATP-binding protein [Elusimicrobiota bacterium]
MSPEDVTSEKARARDVLRVLKSAGVRPWAFLVSALLALSSALCEGASVGLMIPFVRGVLSLNFGFAREPGPARRALELLLPGGEASDRTLFVLFLALIFASAALKHVLQYLSSVCLAREATRFTNSMRKRIFERYLEFGKLFFDRTNVGQLQTTLMGYTGTIGLRLLDLQSALTHMFIMATYLTLMLAISWRLTALVCLVFPVLYRASAVLIQGIRASSYSYTDSRADLDIGIFNALSCILLVKSYSTELVEKRRFGSLSDELSRLEFRVARLQAMIGPIQELILLAMVLLLAAGMGWLVSREGTSRLPSYLIYFYVLKKGTTSFSFFNTVGAGLATVSGEARALAAVLDDRDKFRVPDGTRRFEGVRESIEFRGLEFGYPGASSTIQSLSFTIRKGRMTAIVGPSGSGKTTLINLLLRFYESPRGALLVDGVDLGEYSAASLRARIALVGQDPLLLNDTVRRNVAYGLEGASEASIAAALRQARLWDAVQGFPKGLETRIGDRGVQLSGGEKQRLSIARAILKDADILILDEATSSLDSETERLIQAAIEDLVKGKTSVVVAHRLSTIKNADWIVAIEKGRLVEEGTLPDLLARKGLFHRYWEQQTFY